MKRNELLKSLQSHRKYKTLTQKEISNQLGSIDNIRKELKKLDHKTKKRKNKLNIDTSLIGRTNDDIKMEILLKLKYEDMIPFCQTNKQFHKVCQSNLLWNRMITRDFPFYPDDLPRAEKTYKHWYKYFDEYTIDIISSFIKYRTKYNNLNSVYENIFKLLVDYISINNENMEIEDMEKSAKVMEKSEYELNHRIFNALSIPMVQDFSFMDLVINRNSTKTDRDKWRYLSDIITSMMCQYSDPENSDSD